MELLQTLQTDMKLAMKAGEKQKLNVLRMLINDVKNLDLQTVKLTPMQAVEAYAKRLKKSADEFEKLGRAEEVKSLHEEIAIVDTYLPKKLGAADTESAIDAFLALHAFTEKQLGQATGMFIKSQNGMVDPAVVSSMLKTKLAGK